jgi:steroid delta-isomerase-like uncharacterized protein
MSSQSNLEAGKAVVSAYVKAFNAGAFERMKEIFAEDAVIYGVLGWGGLDAVMPIWRSLHEAFGITLQVEAMAAEGAVVAVRYSERGTFRAPFRQHRPTGKSYEIVAMEWFELEGGRIKRRWGARDSAAQARQLGIEGGL